MVELFTLLGGFVASVVGYSTIRYLGTAHNTLVESREECSRAWANVEVMLERRQDELAALVDVTKEHVDYERDVLQAVVDARQAALEAESPADVASADVSIRSSLSDLKSLSSEYPNLQADERFDELTTSVSTLETRLENRREHYNQTVAAYNTRRKRLPERLFARLHGMRPKTPFVASPEAHEKPNLASQFGSDD